jgi:hypothetical protein
MRRSEENNQPLVPSPVVATNIRQFDAVNPTLSDDHAVFFTGSGLARINLVGKKDTEVKTETLTQDSPVTNITDVSSNGSLVLFRGSYSPTDTVLKETLSGSPPANAAVGQAWFVSKKGSLQAAPFANHTDVYDALVSGDNYYTLEKSGGSQSLVQYNTNEQRSVLASSVSGNSFVGTVENFVITRDYSSVLYVWDGKENKKVADQVGDAYIDITSKTLLYNQATEHDHGEEGGQIQAEAKSTKLSVYGLTDGNTKQLELNSGNVYPQGNGTVISTPSLVRPTSLTITDIVTGEQKTRQINQGDNVVTNQITSIRQVSEDPAVFWAITNTNFLTVWGPTDRVEKLKAYKYPIVPRLRDEFVFNYNVGFSTVGIASDALPKNFVNTSIESLRSGCSCDTNMMAKNWSIHED